MWYYYHWHQVGRVSIGQYDSWQQPGYCPKATVRIANEHLWSCREVE